jgi:hypothetical protein
MKVSGVVAVSFQQGRECMTVVQKELTRIALAAVAALVMYPSADAASVVPEDGKAGVEATVAKVNELVARSASAKEIADVFYEDDLTITGDGEKGLYPNLKSFMKRLEVYSTNPTCRLNVANKIRTSNTLAVAWIQEHCDAHGTESAEDYRILYVFRKSPKGWRTTMELFQKGTL